MFYRYNDFRIYVCVVLVMLFMPQNICSQRYFTEDFDYAAGDLYGCGAWVYHGAGTKTNTILVGEGSLSYSGYSDSPIGNSVSLQDVQSSYSLQAQFSDTPVSTGSVYCSALINVKSVGDGKYFLCFVRGSEDGITDKSNGMDVGRVCLAPADGDENKFKIGVSRTSSREIEYSNVSLDYGETYLIVVKYEFVEGNKNDIVSIWVNPSDYESEPEALAATDNTSSHTSQDVPNIQGIELVQNSMKRDTYPEMTVDAIRVAGAWKDLFTNETSSIRNEEVTLNNPITVYDILGRKVISDVKVGNINDLKNILRSGIYVIRHDSKYTKIAIK